MEYVITSSKWLSEPPNVLVLNGPQQVHSGGQWIDLGPFLADTHFAEWWNNKNVKGVNPFQV